MTLQRRGHPTPLAGRGREKKYGKGKEKSYRC